MKKEPNYYHRSLSPSVCRKMGAEFLEESVYTRTDIEQFLPFLLASMHDFRYARRADLKFVYGLLLLRIGESEKALLALFHWLRNDRSCPYYWALLGLIYQQEEPSQALTFLSYARTKLSQKNLWWETINEAMGACLKQIALDISPQEIESLYKDELPDPPFDLQQDHLEMVVEDRI